VTATNVLIQRNAAYLYADAAYYNADGAIQHITSKIVVLPHLSCAIAFRGAAVFKSLVTDVIGSSATSYDGLRSKIGPLLRDCAVIYKDNLERCETGNEIEVLVAGISESDGPSAYLVNSAGRYGAEPWAVQPVEGFTWLPNTPELVARAKGLLPLDADDVDPIAHGRMIMEMQRETPVLHEFSGVEMTTVGGFIELVAVTRDQIVTRIIHGWPDEVGERVGRGRSIGRRRSMSLAGLSRLKRGRMVKRVGIAAEGSAAATSLYDD